MEVTDLINYANAIKSIESSGNYGSIGPATRSGDRAYGAYQVMGNNIPSWTQKHFGQSLTPQQFLQNKEAQDAVFNGEFGSYVQKQGNPQDAASMWFTGRPLAQGGHSDDGYITGNQYVDRFNKALGAGAGDGVTAINQAMGVNPKGAGTPALAFSGDGEDGGALSPKKSADDESTGGVLFKGEGPNKTQAVGSMLANVGAALAGISNPSAGANLRGIAQGIDAQAGGQYQYQMGPNGQLVRINKKDGTVDSINIPGAQKGNFGVVMGKDPQGNPVPLGKINHDTGEYAPYSVAGAGPAQTSPYGTAVTADNPYGLPADIEDLKSSGPAGVSLYNQLQGIHSGNVQYPTGSRVNKQMEQLRNAAALYFPDLNANDFAARKRYQEENVKQTPGSVGGNKIALNHSYNLIGQISDAMVGLDNSDNAYVPSGIQGMYNNAKNQKPANHALANTLDTQLMPALAGETGKLYYGQGAGGQAEREKISKGLTSSGTKQDQVAGLQTALATLEAREADIDRAAQQAYGKDWEKYASRNDQGKQEIEKIKKNLGILKGELNKDGTPKSIPQGASAAPAAAAPIPSGWKVY